MAQIYYPIGIQTFSSIREGEYLYVDKTPYIMRMLSDRLKYVFLSRPRRFGKSLFLSTLADFFAGRRELFDGLAISHMDYDWREHPVLHMDFTGCNYSEPDGLFHSLDDQFIQWEKRYAIEKTDLPLSDRFRNIIRQAYEQSGMPVVILIDEYDKPLLETVSNPDLQQKLRDTLRSIYGNLKRMDPYIRFAMLTGVTKFGHLSIFSDLNNLYDISFDEHYEAICGITGKEIHTYLLQGVRNLAQYSHLSEEKAFESLKLNYDGYRFSPFGNQDIYNPFSLLCALSKGIVSNYWFQTGTPTFLIKMIKDGNLPITRLDDMRTSVSDLSDVSFDLRNCIPVLYQSGYLTIKDYDREFDEITLGFPNKEVTAGFLNQLLPFYASISPYNTAFEVTKFVMDVREGRAEEFMIRLQSLFADFQYDSFDLGHLEQHYQDVIFIIFKLMGFYTRTEYRTAAGRIDMVVKTQDYIYVMEFKIDRSAEEALAQIDSKDYLIPFRADGRKLIKIGANFDSASRNIASWIIQMD
jgi:hypothetical protein